jgi:hypothetical protein
VKPLLRCFGWLAGPLWRGLTGARSIGRDHCHQALSKLTKRYAHVTNYTDLPEITLQQIRHFFEHYKDLEPGKWVKVIDWGDATEAKKLIAEAIARAQTKGTCWGCMTEILDTARVSQEEPKLIVRKAPHAPVWSVWAVLEGIPSEEIFEGSSEEEASSWINTGGQAWLEERRRKRNA